MQHFAPHIKLPQQDPILGSEEIIRAVENAAVTKAGLTARSTFVLAILAGAMLAMGGVFCSAAIAGLDYGLGPTRLIGGLAFALGFVFVVIAGGELFTSNMVMVVVVADGRVSPLALLRNWALVFVGNLCGALGVVACVAGAGLLTGPDAAGLIHIAEHKMALSPTEVLTRGILCNMFVCLGFWLSVSARTTSGKILGLLWPVAAPVAIGLEHCIADLYLLPAGLLAGASGAPLVAAGTIGLAALGNIIGAAIIGFGYRLAYPRGEAAAA